MHIVKPALLYFAIVFGCGFALGVMRTLWLVPAVGTRIAELCELVKGPEGMTVDAESGLVHWRPKSEQRGRFEVEVAAVDQWGSGVAQRFAIGADSGAAPAAAAP